MFKTKNIFFKGESGITLIALLIMIVVLVILATVSIRALFGDEPLIKTATNAREDYKYTHYEEQVKQVVQGEIVSKSAVGEIASIQNVQEALQDEEWVKTAKIDEGWTEEEGVIIVRVVEGYIYQVYYNSKYGKIIVDSLGKDIPQADLDNLTVTGRYEIQKGKPVVFGTAEDKTKGVKTLELYLNETDEQIGDTKEKPQGEQSWQVERTGWYKIKATSNSGAIKYAYVRIKNISDLLKAPVIEIEPQGTQKAGWYGADGKELWVKVSTENKYAKEIHYTLTGGQLADDVTGELREENGQKYIRFQITETGITNIIAWTEDGNGNSSLEATDVTKFDNVPPVITKSEPDGTAGNNNWYKSAVNIKIEANDPKGILDGYTYRITSDTDQEIKAETHETDISKKISITEDGKYKIYIQAIDQAGNKSVTRTIEVHKDSTPPTVGTVTITNETETSCTVSVAAGDETSRIKQYEYILNGTVLATETTNTVNITGLTPNQTYNVVVRVTDNAGNTKESGSATVTTKGELLPPNVQISGDTRNGYYIGTVTITVNDTSETSKTRVSRIKVTGAGSERTITGTSGSFTITSDGTYTISAWSEDSAGAKSDTTTKPAFTRDATAPSASLSVGSVGTYSIAVTAYGSDSTSGVKSYKFEYKKTSTSTWTTGTTKTTSANSCTYTYSVPSDATTYNLRVTVTDNADWTNVGTNSATTNRANTAPTVTASFASKTTNSITINATGRDNEGGTLTYTLYVKTASGSWQSKATTTGSPSSQVTMTASELTEYTDYYYKVDVRDNGSLTGTTGQLGSIRTYCPGPKICNGTITGKVCSRRVCVVQNTGAEGAHA